MLVIIHEEKSFLDPVVFNDTLDQLAHHFPCFKQQL